MKLQEAHGLRDRSQLLASNILHKKCNIVKGMRIRLHIYKSKQEPLLQKNKYQFFPSVILNEMDIWHTHVCVHQSPCNITKLSYIYPIYSILEFPFLEMLINAVIHHTLLITTLLDIVMASKQPSKGTVETWMVAWFKHLQITGFEVWNIR
jgi:hypothetical protein